MLVEVVTGDPPVAPMLPFVRSKIAVTLEAKPPIKRSWAKLRPAAFA
jgi:hypothetical protein